MRRRSRWGRILGYVSQLDHGLKHIDDALPHLCELALGGTAVGTGLNAHPQFAEKVATSSRN
jgi:fumarate hydratase class II